MFGREPGKLNAARYILASFCVAVATPFWVCAWVLTWAANWVAPD
jgi:hypothetical protein